MRRLASILPALLAAALLGSVTAPRPAHATVMVRASVEELAAESAHVLVGVVRHIEVTSSGPRAGLFTRVELAVEERWRGAGEGARATFWVHGGRLGERAMRTHGQAVFEEGERVLVFLYDAGDGALFPTGMSQGKWTLDGRWARSCAALGSLVVRGADGRLRPSTEPIAPIELDALRARVEAVR